MRGVVGFVRRTGRGRHGCVPSCDGSDAMSKDAPLIVGSGGTARDGSTSERALRIALGEAERFGARTRIFAGQLLNLTAYDPAAKNRSVAALDLVDALRGADGIIIATPSYHGSISGLIKNAIDYAEFCGRTRGFIFPIARSVPLFVPMEFKRWDPRLLRCAQSFTPYAGSRRHSPQPSTRHCGLSRLTANVPIL